MRKFKHPFAVRRKYLIEKLKAVCQLFVSSHLIRNYKLKNERQQLIDKRHYLLSNGFSIEFKGRNYIDECILEITKELNNKYK